MSSGYLCKQKDGLTLNELTEIVGATPEQAVNDIEVRANSAMEQASTLQSAAAATLNVTDTIATSLAIVDNPQGFTILNPPEAGRSYSNAVHRLSMLDSELAWSPGIHDANQFMQIDAGGVVLFAGVVTQGRNSKSVGYPQWVTQYQVEASNDGVAFRRVYNANGGITFHGNSDNDTRAYRLFNIPVQARYVRIRPTSWSHHILMRAALLTQEIPDAVSGAELESRLPQACLVYRANRGDIGNNRYNWRGGFRGTPWGMPDAGSNLVIDPYEYCSAYNTPLLVGNYWLTDTRRRMFTDTRRNAAPPSMDLRGIYTGIRHVRVYNLTYTITHTDSNGRPELHHVDCNKETLPSLATAPFEDIAPGTFKELPGWASVVVRVRNHQEDLTDNGSFVMQCSNPNQPCTNCPDNRPVPPFVAKWDHNTWYEAPHNATCAIQ